MSTCSVKTCKNDSRKMKNIQFFRFPKDKTLLLKWVAACEKENIINVKNGRICSAHFDATAYKEPSWMRPLLGYTTPKKRTLKPDAVPTQNLGLPTSLSSIVKRLDKSASTAINAILPGEEINTKEINKYIQKKEKKLRKIINIKK